MSKVDTEFNNGVLTLKANGCQYEARGIKLRISDSMRLSVTLRAYDTTYRNKVDLYLDKQRKRFAKDACGVLALPEEAIYRDLGQLIETVESIQASNLVPAHRNKPVILSDVERQEAIEYLKQPDLLDAIAKDINRIGVVGEEQNKRLVYLVAVSRKLDTPLSCIIQSESGSGKSYLMDMIAGMCPPEDVALLSRLTSQCLYYMPDGSLQHRLLVVDERAGSSESDYSLRTLQSQRRLTLAIPLKDPLTGRTSTQEFTVKGPVAFLESTTSLNINPENLSRSLVVHLDESRKQTLFIQKRQREILAGKWAGDRDAIIKRHQNIQRVLERKLVIIPFAEDIEFPASQVRNRRDQSKLLSLIQSHTLLYQYQRGTRKDCLIATPEDLDIALGLMKEMIPEDTGELSQSAKELLTYMESKEIDQITRRELSRMMNWSYGKAYSVLQDLVKYEFLAPNHRENGKLRTYQRVS